MTGEATSMSLLGWVVLLPLLGFLILFLTEGRLGKRTVAIVGAGSMALSSLFALLVSIAFIDSGQSVYVHNLWQWMDVGGFTPHIRLYFDGLAMVMVGVITGVGISHSRIRHRLHGRRKRLQPLFCVHELVCVCDVDTGPGRQPAGALSRLGRGRLM